MPCYLINENFEALLYNFIEDHAILCDNLPNKSELTSSMIE